MYEIYLHFDRNVPNVQNVLYRIYSTECTEGMYVHSIPYQTIPYHTISYHIKLYFGGLSTVREIYKLIELFVFVVFYLFFFYMMCFSNWYYLLYNIPNIFLLFFITVFLILIDNYAIMKFIILDIFIYF